MGRGSGQQRKLSQQQLGIERGNVEYERRLREEGRGRILPKAEKLYSEAGLSPDEEAALTAETVGGVGNVFDAMREHAGARLARTGNSAGYYDAMGELGREEARTKEGAQRKNVLTRRGARREDEDAALRLMASLYGIDTNLLGGISGLPIGALGQNAAGIARTSFGVPGLFNFGQG